MNILLDTHVFLWYVTEDAKLPPGFADAIRDERNEVLLSVASSWEIVIKSSTGKLTLPNDPERFVATQRAAHHIESLSIDEGAMPHVASLPLLHRDPFDRLLVAQALQHDLTLATVDSQVLQYGVEFLGQG